MTNKARIFACGEITSRSPYLIISASSAHQPGGEMFKVAKNGKYADEYLRMLK